MSLSQTEETVLELAAQVTEAWTDILQNNIRTVIDSMPARIQK